MSRKGKLLDKITQRLNKILEDDPACCINFFLVAPLTLISAFLVMILGHNLPAACSLIAIATFFTGMCFAPTEPDY